MLGLDKIRFWYYVAGQVLQTGQDGTVKGRKGPLAQDRADRTGKVMQERTGQVRKVYIKTVTQFSKYSFFIMNSPLFNRQQTFADRTAQEKSNGIGLNLLDVTIIDFHSKTNQFFLLSPPSEKEMLDLSYKEANTGAERGSHCPTI